LYRWYGRAVGRQAQRPLIILYYHSVAVAKRAGFSRQLDILARHAHVVPADWSGATHASLPTVAITFDDALASVADNALPELAKREFSCVIFAPAGVLGRQPNWSMEGRGRRDEVVVDAARLRSLRSDLVAIGAHSVTHPRLTELPSARAREEIVGSQRALTDLLGVAVTLFAFPYGDHDERIVEICREEGFQQVFTIIPQPVVSCAGTFVRGRVSVEPDDGDLEFFLKMSGAYAWMPLASTAKRRLRASLGVLRQRVVAE
jgi:peptidoglycan/xylan/chitin deacetylase (PgdA/CDA1 family)